MSKTWGLFSGGTEKAYSFIDFNPKGNLLASVGSAPDYMLTVWDWQIEKIMLRSKVRRLQFLVGLVGFQVV